LTEKETILSNIKYLFTVAFDMLNPVTGLSSQRLLAQGLKQLKLDLIMLQVKDLVLMQAPRARYLGRAAHEVQCHQLSIEDTGLLNLLFVAFLSEHVGFDT
jgi:hypothetical protein